MPNPAGERLARLSRVATIRAAALTGRLGPDQHGPDPHGASDLAAVLNKHRNPPRRTLVQRFLGG